MPTMIVTSDYMLPEDQTLTFTEVTGMVLRAGPPSSAPPAITLAGDFSLTYSGGLDTHVRGIAADSGYSGAPGGNYLVWIKPGASFSVATTGDAYAYGYTTAWGSWPSFYNAGDFSVASQGMAHGVYGENWDFAFFNYGDFTVGGKSARGVTLAHARFYNAGDIIVSAASPTGSAEGVVSDADLDFNNAGLIRITDQNPDQKTVALLVSSQTDSFSTISIVNSGRIEADTAIQIRIWGSFPTWTTKVVRNEASGQIVGDIIVAGASGAITNLGLIVGDIRLDNGDNSYQGAQGTLQGALYAGAGENIIVMGAGDDRVFAAHGDGAGEDGANQISGGAGADILHSGRGDDQLTGGDGGDVLQASGGVNSLNGGAGADTASYADAELGVAVRLGVAGMQNTNVSLDTITSIENVVGSSFNDRLTGDVGANRLAGGAGSDVLYGLAGDDVLVGGGGIAGAPDYLYGGAGNDTYYVASTLTGPLDLVFEGVLFAGSEAGVGDADVIHSTGQFFWDYYSVAETLYIDNAIDGGAHLIGGKDVAEKSIVGSSGVDLISTYGRNARVDGGAGSDAISFSLYGLDESYRGANTVVMKAGNGMDYVYDFRSGTDHVDLTAFNFGITGAQVLAQAVNIDNPGTADDYCYFYLTSAGGVDNFIVFMGLLSSGLQAGDFVT